MKKNSNILKLTSFVLSSPMMFTACAAVTNETTDTAPAEPTDTETEAQTTDTESVETETETTAPEPVRTGTVRLYQLVPETSSLMMSYVILTPNKKVIVIDGGIDGVGVESKTYLPAAIRAILGLEEGEYFEVEAWFLTHAHRDHYYELAKMLNEYNENSNYKINSIYFDFPEIGVEWDSAAGSGDYDFARLDKLKKGMDNYYSITGFNGIKGADIPKDMWKMPDGAENYYYDLVNGAVINTDSTDKGLAIEVDGVRFDILMTWCKEAKYVNSTSVIMRMTFGGHSVLFLADCASDEGKRLLERYEPEQLKSEYVQMGHHGQGGPDKEFYDAIDATDSKRLWPTPAWVWNDAKTYKIGETRSWVGLPFEAADYKKDGCQNSGNDFVAGLYKKCPSGGANKVSKWTEPALNAQLVAEFEAEITQ